MRIFSNFDSQISKKLFENLKNNQWDENILLVKRWKIYFISKIVFPAIFAVIIFVLLKIYGLRIEFDSLFLEKAKWVKIVLLNIILIWPLFLKIFRNWIDYTLDFALIWKKQIILHDQLWFFSKQTQTLDVAKVRKIVVLKSGVLKSIFNYWEIVFLSQGSGNSNEEEARIEYISNPENVVEQIKHIIFSNENNTSANS